MDGLILDATAAFIIERSFHKAAGFALAGAILTFFGFMHGEAIGLGRTPMVAVSYLVVAGILMGCARFVTVPSPVTAKEHPEPLFGTAD